MRPAVAAVAISCLAGSLTWVTAVQPAAAAGALPTCTAYFEGTEASWSNQNLWYTSDSTASPLGYVPGSSGHTGDVACWSGQHEPYVDGTFTVQSVQDTGSSEYVSTDPETADEGESLRISTGNLTLTGVSSLAGELYMSTGDGSASTASFTLATGASLSAHVFSGDGTVTLDDGSSFTGTDVGNSGADRSDFESGDATVNGTVTITAANTIDDGSIALGSNAPGFLKVNGSYDQTGSLSAYLGGTATGDFSQVSVSGQAALYGGTMAISKPAGYTPAAGDTFPVVTSTGSTLQGVLSFTGITGRDIDGDAPGADDLVPQYSSNALTLAAEPEFTPATGLLLSGEPTGSTDSTISVRDDSGTATALTTGHDPELSTDYRYLVYKSGTSDNRNNASLVVRDMATGATTDLTLPDVTTPSIVGASISPDDSYIAFDDDCALYVEPLIGGTPTAITRGTSECYTNPQFSPDGSQIIVSASGGSSDGLYVSSVSNIYYGYDYVSEIANTQPGDGNPAISPDGSTVAFTRPVSGSPTQFNVFVTPNQVVESDDASRDARNSRHAVSDSTTSLSTAALSYGAESPLRWSPDGSAVYATGTYDDGAGGGGRDGIYRFEDSADGTPELVGDPFAVSPSILGSDSAVSLALGDDVATTLPSKLTAGAAASGFTVAADAPLQKDDGPDLTFTFSGIPGLAASDITLTAGGKVLTVSSGAGGTLTASDNDPFDGALGMGEALSQGYSIALSSATPAGTLQVTTGLSDEGGSPLATADAPIVVDGVAATAPTITSATHGDGSAVVTFTAGTEPAGTTISGYTVTLTPVTGGESVTNTVASDGPFDPTISGLVNGTTYNATVTATLTGGGNGPTSNTVAVTPSGVPFAPTPFTATVTGQGQVQVAVGTAPDNGSPVTDYHVTLGGQTRDLGSAGPVTFSGLADNTSYIAMGFAVNANGNGATATSNGVTTPPTPAPGAVGSVAAVAGDRQATITFTPAAGGTPASSYLVTLTPVRGGSSVSVTTQGSPVVVPGLVNGVTYAVAVVGESAFGSSPIGGGGVTVTPHGKPTAPHITGIAPAPETLLVGFTQADGDGLPILGDTVTCVGANHKTSVVHGSGSPIKISHLVNAVNYTCSVVALTSAGNSPVSNKVVAHPGKLPNVALLLPASAPKGSYITIVATLTAAGDVVPFRLATLSVQYGIHATFTVIAKGYTNRRGVVTYRVRLKKKSTYQVRALFGPAVAYNHGLTVDAV